jgi:hypothetical protein
MLIWFACVSGSLAQTVFISEFLADNQLNTKVDEDGDHSDWLEIWNSGASTINLNGWYLTDDSGDLRKWQFPPASPSVPLAAGARIVVFASNKNRKLDITKLHTNFKLSKNAGSYLALVRPDGLTVEHAYASYPLQVQDITYGLAITAQWQTLVAPTASGKVKVPLSSADMAVGWNSSTTYDVSTWQSGQSGFGYDTTGSLQSAGLIGAGGDVQASMYNVNSSAMLRYVFNVTDPASIIALRLSIKYDDGFNCYLNGHLIQQSFSAGTAWNAQALLDRNGTLTSTYQVFNPANSPQQWLVPGTNVLAFQILNYSTGGTAESDGSGTTNGSRVLCLPFLEGNFSNGVGTPAYLASATPGAANSAARTSLGPAISHETAKFPGQVTTELPRPTGDAASLPIVVTAKVTPTLQSLAASTPVQLKYVVMFGTESTITMKDDGISPDAQAGDGIFTAQIPTTNIASTYGLSTNLGQMIRWRIVASDTAGASSTSPPFLDPSDNEQYYGTATADGITTSQLPVLHMFITDADLATTESADNNYVRPSLFYLGRFYDNVRMDRHGQSTASFPKKSYNFNFNQDNRFTYQDGQDSCRAINLLSNWADKSKVRLSLAWESWAECQHVASHWCHSVRLQKNGVFRAIYDMVENGDESFLSRSGMDTLGALYKIYNSLENTNISVSDSNGIEKKTGYPITDFSDIAALETALATTNSLASRRQWSYDHVDVPTLVNYLATNVIVLNNDFGHKNYYMYRDTYGTGEWAVLPWDEDLTYGHTWTSSQSYFNDDIDSQRGLNMGSAAGNRLMNLIMNTAGNSTLAAEMVQMFLRRVRTLMDRKFVSASATDGPVEQRVNQLLDLLDPPGAAYLTDSDLDLQKWGYWVDGNGSQLSPNNAFDAATHDHGARKSALRIIDNASHTGNPIPPYPGSVTNAEGLGNTTYAYVTGRRALLFNSSPTLNNQPIPTSQAAVPTGLVFEQIDFNPASGNQAQEYFILRNNSANYIDISGWKITGAVRYTFRGGTVIPPFTSGSAYTATGDVHNGRLHVVRDPAQFRARTTSPKANEFRLAVGPYSGQLSARGETLNLVIPGATAAQDVIVASTTYAGAPTASQSYLRITELNFNPAPPSPAESLALPGVQAGDFEFLELMNTGPSPLNIGGASFDKGITFTFPANFTLQPGQRCVVVSLLAAFNLRYGAAGANVAGQYEGNLSNDGETIRILDPVGESVLEFTYDPLWFGVPKPGAPATTISLAGYSLVTKTNSPAYDGYENPLNWALTDTAGGTPGTPDSTFANAFVGWRKSYFSTAEEANPVLSDPAADADGDGRINFEEYAFGGNPRVMDNATRPTSSIVNVGGVNYLAVTFNRRHHAVDTTYAVEASDDLTSWMSINIPVGSPTDLGSGLEQVTYRDSQAVGQTPRYLRVRATR